MIDKDLLKLLGPNKKYVFLTVLVMVISLLANTSITISICWAIAYAIDKVTTYVYIYPAILLLLGIILRYICSRVTGSLKDSLGRHVKKDLREKTYKKIISLGLQSTNDMAMSGLTQISIEGVEQLDIYYSTYLPQFFYALLAPIILFCFNVSIDWRVSLILLCCVPLIPMSIVAVSKYAKRIFAKYWGIYTSMGDKFLDSIRGLTELKIFKADKRQNEKLNVYAEDFRKVTMKVLIMQLASTTIMDLVAYGAAGAGIAVAILDLSSGYLTDMASCLFLILIAVEFFLPMRALGSAFHVAMNGVSAGRKILNLLNMPDPIWGDKEVEDTTMSLKDVTFSYDGKRDVLSDINIVIPKNKMTAIVGKSGSGKSTIVSLFTGAHHPQKGEVLIGGDDITTLKRESFYSHIAVIRYDTYIFNDTVRANFKMAKDDVTEEEIRDALRKVNLEHFILDSFGLDNKIEENASNMSGGEKQRLALAINLVADKDIYIFDEATSNIDVDSEEIIMNNIRKLRETKSVLLISHRLENVVQADHIYYLENGRLTEEGTHQDLLTKKEGYFTLYSTQKELEEGYKKTLEVAL